MLGVLSYRRLVEISVEDVLYVAAIQDMGQWYATRLPPGLPASMTAPRSGAPLWSLAQTRTRSGLLPLLSTTASVVAMVTSFICGGGAALLAAGPTDGFTTPAVAGVVVAVALMIMFSLDQSRRFRRAADAH